MHYNKTAQKRKKAIRLCGLIFLVVPSAMLFAQAPVLRVTNSFTKQTILYNTDTFPHTAWQPVLYTDSTYIKSNKSWVYRKFFEEHLLQVQEPGFNIFGDIVFDEYIGGTKRAVPTQNFHAGGGKSKTMFMNTRGYTFNGNIGRNFYFETDLYENQGRFPGYVDSFVRSTGVVPFQNRYKRSEERRVGK